MFDKLRQIEEKFIDLEERMGTPEVYSDPAAYAKCAREQKELSPIVECYRRYVRLSQDMEDAQLLMEDAEMREFAQEEYAQAKEGMEQCVEELKILLLPKDPNDSRNVIMEIRGGVGGEEGMLFASNLFRMYSMYVERRG